MCSSRCPWLSPVALTVALLAGACGEQPGARAEMQRVATFRETQPVPHRHRQGRRPRGGGPSRPGAAVPPRRRARQRRPAGGVPTRRAAGDDRRRRGARPQPDPALSRRAGHASVPVRRGAPDRRGDRGLRLMRVLQRGDRAVLRVRQLQAGRHPAVRARGAGARSGRAAGAELGRADRGLGGRRRAGRPLRVRGKPRHLVLRGRPRRRAAAHAGHYLVALQQGEHAFGVDRRPRRRRVRHHVPRRRRAGRRRCARHGRIDATTRPLGPSFPTGLCVAPDGYNRGGNRTSSSSAGTSRQSSRRRPTAEAGHAPLRRRR